MTAGPDDRFAADGFLHRPALVADLVAPLRAHPAFTDKRAGNRLFGDPAIRAAAHHPPLLATVQRWLGPAARPVRALAFDKSATSNWALGWHQDRTIAVRDCAETSGFDHWTVKRGVTHVEPPFALIERMISVRLHLDPVDADNAPLLVVPGSHRLGRIPADRVATVVAQGGSYACLAHVGDVWMTATPILHASDRSTGGRRRRVLQIDYCADDLPQPLEWQGV